MKQLNVTLHKRSSTGKIQEWTIEVENNMFRTTEGFVNGAKTTTAWTICEGKNVGRSNETTPQEQAVREAASRIEKQKDKGWVESIKDVDKRLNDTVVKPMLAKDAKDGWLDRLLESGHSIALQPKLDGIRDVIADKMYSRNLKIFVSSPHILEIVEEVRMAMREEFLILDGELYNHEYHDNFNKIASLIKKSKPSPEDLKESAEKVQYHIFDTVDTKKTFNERWRDARLFYNTYQELYPGGTAIQLVPTKFLNKATRADVDKYYEEMMELGYEGHMARKSFSLYQPDKRSADLIKRKEMQDDEFKITDIEQGKGNRQGVAARVYVVDGKGVTSKAGIIGDMEFCKKLLVEKDKYIGKWATVQFQNYTPDGALRFAKMKAIRDYE